VAFFLLLLYLVLTCLRPWDLIPSLAPLRLSFWVGNAALFFSTLGFIASGRYSLLSVPAFFFLISFFVVLILSPALATGWIGGISKAFTESMVNVVTCILIFLSARTVGKVRVVGAVLTALLMIVVVQGALAYYGYYATEELVMVQRTDEMNEAGQRASFGRVRGLGQLNDPNDLAQALIVAAPLLWPVWRQGRKLRNFLFVVIPSLVLLYGVYLTRSRGALLSILILVALFLRERMTRFRLITPIATAAVIGATMMASGFTGGRDMSDSSSEGRLEAWYDGLQMLQGSPLFGVGFGNFVDHHIRVAHNSFIHCFAELGMAGYFLWIGLLIAIHTDMVALGTPEDEDDEESVSLARWATAVRFCLYAFLSGAFFLSRTYATALYTIVGLAITLSAIGRNYGWVTTQWQTLVTRAALTSSLSVVAIYIFVMVAKRIG
jgi:putative inorganic carbon (hco3(-)) transporter